ncbi:MAG: ribonuclease H-like domain-containing protein [Candidatus Diapherotrites archaeon]
MLYRMSYIVVDVETSPIDIKEYDKRNEEEKKKMLNPIDSKIIAIGIKAKDNEAQIFLGEEKEILGEFWVNIKKHKQKANKIIGFNIKDFDLPFLVTRSFLNDVEIEPFILKEIIDIREKLSAYKWGNVRGKLKEFAKLLSIPTLGIEGDKINELYINKDFKTIKEYLTKDLEITELLYERIVKLKIDKIEKW